ncbi:MAG: hypothetical protein ACOCYE_14545, partial [Pseudomonadota bacterium]
MSAFSASIERSFAAADGPEWHRLTPPSLPWGLAEASEVSAGSSRRATVPPRRRPGRWRAPVVAGGLVLAVLVAVQLWSGRQPAPEASGTRLTVPLAPTTPALVAEATRRAAGRPVDLATGPSEARFSVARPLPGVAPGAVFFVCQHHTPEAVW